jgi:hypothetical protein
MGMATDTARVAKTVVAAGPHQAIAATDEREQFTAQLFDRLWDRYRQRVPYVRKYEELVQKSGGRFVNDHIAFRTFACQTPQVGIVSLSRLFEALGYKAAGIYYFDDKHLFAVHYQHANIDFPKLFISELQTWKLSAGSQSIILRDVASHRAPLSQQTLGDLRHLPELDAGQRQYLLDLAVRWIEELPWDVPPKDDVAALDAESQYAAWVLVHGYNVNHFTSLINSHGVERLSNIEKTIAELRGAGVPMKAEIEGAAGSVLRQTATEAAVLDVSVRDGSRNSTLPWTYAYFELAERGFITDAASGERRRFEGFLGAQATQLFEMTKRR